MQTDISSEEENKLIETYQKTKDNKIRDFLIKRHYKYIVSSANKYSNIQSLTPDLIQQGCIGLSEAIDKFDTKRGVKFLTYANYWIKARMCDMVLDNYIIKVPSTRYTAKVSSLLRKNPELTPLQISRKLKIKLKYVKDSLNMLSIKTEYLDSMAFSTSENIVHSNKNTNFLEYQILEKDEKEHRMNQINDAMNFLSKKERKVIRDYYIKERDYRRIADDFGVTRQRIEQIKQEALDKLKDTLCDLR